jgi:Tfp pilus assembly protein PilE
MKTLFSKFFKRNAGRAARIRGRVPGPSLWVRPVASPCSSAATGRSYRFARERVQGLSLWVRPMASPCSSAATGRSGRFARNNRSGATLVEMLVVILIVTLVAIALSKAISAALTLEQNFREESAVRTALALQLAYAERYLSLATNITITSVGDAYTAVYRLETGGVSFETNRFCGVRSNQLALAAFGTNQIVNFKIFSGTNTIGTDRAFSAYGLLRTAPAHVTRMSLQDTGRGWRLELEATYTFQTGTVHKGTVTTNMTVSRPIRLWNQ